MASGVRDVLFRLVGDEDDAVRSLKHTAAELEAFGKIHAEASADVDSTEANARLDDLEVHLDRLDTKNVDPHIEADIGQARANLAELQALMEAIDRQDVEVDVKMKRDLLNRLRSMTGQVNSLSRAVDTASEGTATFGQRILNSAVHFGPFTTQLRTFIPLVFAASGAIASVVGALGALIASATEAVAGLGAHAIAFGGTLVPAVATAIITFQHFQQALERTGSTASRVAKIVQGIGGQFDTGAIARPLERGVLDVAQRARGLDLGRQLTPALQGFSRDAAAGIREFGRVVLKPRVVQQFVDLIERAGDAIRPLGRIAGDVFRILTNIAQAAMPFLQRALEGFASGLDQIKRRTNDIEGLRAIIGKLVDQLGLWLELIHQVSRVFIGFTRAMAPAGGRLVRFFAEGAKALADWANSEEGRKRIREFLRDVLPLFKDLVNFIGQLIVLLLQLGEIAAPLLRPMIGALSFVLRLLNRLLEWFNSSKVGRAIKQWAAVAVEAVFTPIQTIRKLVDFLRDRIPQAWDDLKAATVRAWRDMLRSAGRWWGAIKDVVVGAARGAAKLATGAWEKLKDGARDAWRFIANLARIWWQHSILRIVVNAIRAMARIAVRVWNGMGKAFADFKNGIVRIAKAIVGAFRWVGNKVKDVINWIVDKVNKAVQVLGDLKDKIPFVGGGDAPGAGGIGGIIGSAFQNVVPGGGITGGIGDVLGGITGQTGGVWGKVRGAAHGDITPVNAMLEPGELFGVINRRAAKFVEWINGQIPRFGMQIGGLQPGAASLAKLFLSKFGGTLSSTLRPGDTGSLHSTGQAFDWVGGNWAAAATFANSIGRQLLEGIYTGAHGGPPVSWDTGRQVPHSFWGADWAPHSTHIHMGIGEMVKGAVAGAIGQMFDLKKLKFPGSGVFQNLGLGSVKKVAAAANKFVAKLQPAMGKVPSVHGAFSKQALMQLWSATGNNGDPNLMAAIALAESGGDPNADNGIARGLWQIISGTWSAFGKGSWDNAFNPQLNAEAAHRILASGGLGQWDAYSNGSYRSFLARGIKNAMGGLKVVGERGPELLNMSKGSDVYDAARSRRILDRLADPHGIGSTVGVNLYGDLISDLRDPVGVLVNGREFRLGVNEEIKTSEKHNRQKARMRRG